MNKLVILVILQNQEKAPQLITSTGNVKIGSDVTVVFKWTRLLNVIQPSRFMGYIMIHKLEISNVKVETTTAR